MKLKTYVGKFSLAISMISISSSGMPLLRISKASFESTTWQVEQASVPSQAPANKKKIKFGTQYQEKREAIFAIENIPK